MPRPVAALVGFAVVAVSIGYNTVRYPVVWDMVNPPGVSNAMQPAVASTEQTVTAASPPSQREPAPSPEPTPIDVKAAASTAGEKSQPADGVENGDTTAAQPETQRQLVPVVPVGLSGGASLDTAVAGLRRLPPVTSADGVIGRGGTPETGGTISVYPTTGIE